LMLLGMSWSRGAIVVASVEISGWLFWVVAGGDDGELVVTGWQQRCETMYQHVPYTPIVDNQIELFDHRFSRLSLWDHVGRCSGCGKVG